MSKETRLRCHKELSEILELREEARKLRHAAIAICDKYVSSDFYPAARAEIDKVHEEVKDNA